MRTKNILLVLLCFVLLAPVFPLQAKVVDSIGRDFIFAFQPNFRNEGNLSLMIAAEKNTRGVVQIPGLNISIPFDVEPNIITTVDLPRSAQDLIHDQITNLGIRVTAEDDITIYGLNLRDSSTDAFLALPIETLGMEYVIMSEVGTDTIVPSQMVVVGVYDNTEVTITPSESAKGRIQKIPFTVQLNHGETYALEASRNNDLTGTIVESSAPVSVLSGSECSIVVARACDHLVEMIPPVSTWGKSFLTVQLGGRGGGDIVRMLAARDNTVIHINGKDNSIPNDVKTLNRGEYYTRLFGGPTEIISSEPILVAQYATGIAYDRAEYGDPFMMLISPTEQFLNGYTFNSLGVSDGFRSSFINVIAPTSEISAIILDGLPLDEHISKSFYVPRSIESSGYSGVQITLDSGSHHISSQVPFGIYVYGFDDADSYGYPGGMRLERINPPADAFPPQVKFSQFGFSIRGVAGDDEDLNLNGILDPGEDINSNGVIDARTEDINGDGILDNGEDTNNNGKLDTDSGIFNVALEEGSINLSLNVDSVVPGAAKTNFTVNIIDPNAPSSGNVIITDAGGNITKLPVAFKPLTTLNGVRVISALSTADIDLDQTSFSIYPESISVIGDETLIEWNFANIDIGQVENLDYDVVLKNLLPGEERIVTQRLYMSYVDINGNEHISELPEQVVVVRSSVFGLNIQSDRAIYTENEIVNSSATLTNFGLNSAITNVVVNITDINGLVIENIGAFSGVSLNAGESLNLALAAFNTSTLYTGKYIIQAQLLTADNEVIDVVEAPFTIISSVETSIALSVTTDKLTYLPTDTAQTTIRIENKAANAQIVGRTAKTTIYSPTGSAYWTRTNQVPPLTPGGYTSFFYSIGLLQAAPGRYRAETIIEADSGSIEIIDDAIFNVQSTAETAIGLVGNVEISDNPVFKSQVVNLASTIKNAGNAPINNGKLTLTVIDPALQLVLEEWVISDVDIPLGQEFVFDQEYTVNADPGSIYFVILSANTSDGLRLLAQESFEVEESINADLTLVNDSRLLVLIDSIKAQTNGDENGDEYDINHTNGSDINAQRLILEKILDASRWTYTITDNKDTFTSELRSGGYTTYALFSERIKLDNQVLKELREAVYRGDGLLVVGSHDSRNKSVFDMLGIKITGSKAITSSIDLFGETPYAEETSNVIDGMSVKQVEILDASIIGIFQTGSENDIAVTRRSYGDGKSVYINFDLLSQASINNGNQFLQQLLTSGLSDIRPNVIDIVSGSVVPLSILLSNDGGPTLGQAVINLPPNLEVVATSEPLQIDDNQLIWPFSLGTDEVRDLRLWLRLPEIVGDINITTLIQLGVSPNLNDTGTLITTLSVQAAFDLEDVWDDIQVLADTKDYKKAARYIKDAINAENAGDYSHSLVSAINASDELSRIDTEKAKLLRKKLAYAIRGIEINLP